jgi:hypothetical protein
VPNFLVPSAGAEAGPIPMAGFDRFKGAGRMPKSGAACNACARKCGEFSDLVAALTSIARTIRHGPACPGHPFCFA